MKGGGGITKQFLGRTARHGNQYQDTGWELFLPAPGKAMGRQVVEARGRGFNGQDSHVGRGAADARCHGSTNGLGAGLRLHRGCEARGECTQGNQLGRSSELVAGEGCFVWGDYVHAGRAGVRQLDSSQQPLPVITVLGEGAAKMSIVPVVAKLRGNLKDTQKVGTTHS